MSSFPPPDLNPPGFGQEDLFAGMTMPHHLRPEGLLREPGSKTQLDAARLYDVIHGEYLLTGLEAHRDDNPPKTDIGLSMEGPMSTSFFNVMSARLSNGYFGAKAIYCDMRDGRTVSKTLLFDPKGNFLAALDSAGLTAIRCGYMAAVATRMALPDVDLRNLKVGFLGLGSINLRTAWVLRNVFGVGQMTGRGHPLRPRKNLFLFPNGTTLAATVEDFRDCDVVYVATNETSRKRQLDFHRFGSCRLFICQDTGSMLDPSFRRAFRSYADDPVSLMLHWADNFPWDDQKYPLARMSEIGRGEHAVVYLYGMAFADVIVGIDHLGLLSK